MALRALVALAACGWMACSTSVEATSPFDPETPAAQQAPGSLSGTLVLEDDAALDGASVELWSLGEEAGLVASAGVVPLEEPAGEASFSFGEVTPGRYQVVARAPGHAPRDALVRVSARVDTPLGRLRLEPRPAVVVGTVRLDPEPTAGHGGVRVEAVGTAFATTTASSGRFQLELRAGRHDLQLSHVGYAPTRLADLEVPTETALDLGEVVLVGQAGRVRGSVQLEPRFASEGRVAMAQVDLYVGDEAEPVATQAPDATGRFDFAEVGHGEYRVEATLEGFHLAGRDRVQIEVGRSVDVGTLVLFFASAPDSAAHLSGRVLLEGVAEGQHGRTLVEVVGAPLATVTTSDGAFELPVLPNLENRLRFSHAGYETRTEGPFTVAPGESEVIGEAFRLAGEPGVVRGTLRLLGFGDPAVLGGVQVELKRDGEALHGARPDLTGAFAFDAVGAGDYVLRASVAGYVAEARPLSLAVGETLQVGRLDLEHESRTNAAVPFEGLVRLGGRADHGGTRVELRIVGREVTLATAFTDPAGRVLVPASDDERYRLVVERPGYVSPAGEEVYAWAPDRGRFEAEGAPGSPIEIELESAPLDGRIDVEVQVRPDWIPDAQRFVRVTLRGPGVAEVAERVEDGATHAFRGLPAGTYTVEASRAGFRSAEARVALDAEHREVDVGRLEVDLERLAGSGVRLERVHTCQLREGIDLVGADLAGVVVTGPLGRSEDESCPGWDMDPPGAEDPRRAALDLRGADLRNADLTNADLSGAQLPGASLFGARMAGVVAEHANLRGANLFGADLEGARLGGATLSLANLASANLSEARFLLEEEAPGTIPCGAGGPSVTLDDASLAQTDFTGADLSGVDLEGAALSNAILRDADLHGACLAGARMTLLDLSGADLSRADLSDAFLTGSVMTRARFRGATLDRAILSGAVIHLADFGPVFVEPDQHCEPFAWEAEAEAERYDVACAGDLRWTESRCCRSSLRDADFNGADVVGGLFREADLSGASMLGMTVADADEMPPAQPADCIPEVYNDCYDNCLAFNCAANVVEGLQPVGDCVAAAEGCAFEAFEEGAAYTIRPEAACIADAWSEAGESCQGIALGLRVLACVQDPEGVPGERREPPCAWEDILGGACEAERIPRVCRVRQTSLAGARLTGARLSGVALNHVDLSDTLLDGADLRNAVAVDTQARGARFRGADLQNASLAAANLSDVDFRAARMNRVDLEAAILDGANLSEVSINAANLRRTRIVAPVIRGSAPLAAAEVDLSGALIRDADLQYAVLVGAQLQGTTLVGVDLSDANLTDARFDGAVVQGTAEDRAPMRRVDLRGAIIRGSELDRVRMREAILRSAVIDDTRLTAVDLREVRFDGGRLVGSRLGNEDPSCASAEADSTCNRFADSTWVNTRLVGSSVERVYLEAVDFAGAEVLGGSLRGSDFEGAELPGTAFGPWLGVGTDLRGARFGRVGFADTRFRSAQLGEAVFEAIDCSATGLEDACLVLEDADLRGARFQDSVLTRPTFLRADLSGATFLQTRIEGGTWAGVTMERGEFVDTVMTGARISGTRLSGVGMDGVTIAESELEEVCIQNLRTRSAALGEPPPGEYVATLREGELRGVRLLEERDDPDPRAAFGFGYLDFDSVRLVDSDLSGARLSGSRFRSVVFDQVNTGAAEFAGALFDGADLRGICGGGDFGGAVLQNGGFVCQEDVDGGLFAQADLRPDGPQIVPCPDRPADCPRIACFDVGRDAIQPEP